MSSLVISGSVVNTLIHRWLARYVFGSLTIVLYATLVIPPSHIYAEGTTDGNIVVTSNEVVAALANTPGVLSSSSQTRTSSDADSAMQAVASGVSVDVPRDPSEGITLATAYGSKQAIDVTLPNADVAADARQVAPGTVAYPSSNGSASAVQAAADGSVRMMTVIDNPSAPTEYDYKISVPDGGRVVLDGVGGAMIVDDQEQVIAIIDAPWAKDAKGASINTFFTTDGKTLSQHVEHNVAGVNYPITADPRFSWGWLSVTMYLSKSETQLAAWGTGAVSAYYGMLGVSGLVGYSAQDIARWGTSHGYCLALTKPYYNRLISPWLYRC